MKRQIKHPEKLTGASIGSKEVNTLILENSFHVLRIKNMSIFPQTEIAGSNISVVFMTTDFHMFIFFRYLYLWLTPVNTLCPSVSFSCSAGDAQQINTRRRKIAPGLTLSTID